MDADVSSVIMIDISARHLIYSRFLRMRMAELMHTNADKDDLHAKCLAAVVNIVQ
jgi:hypothetical protein